MGISTCMRGEGMSTDAWGPQMTRIRRTASITWMRPLLHSMSALVMAPPMTAARRVSKGGHQDGAEDGRIIHTRGQPLLPGLLAPHTHDTLAARLGVDRELDSLGVQRRDCR